MPKVGSNYIYWSIILINSVLKKDESYYPQVFLKECKYIEKEEKVILYIINDLKIFPDDSDKEKFAFNNYKKKFCKRKKLTFYKLFKTSLDFLCPLNYLYHLNYLLG